MKIEVTTVATVTARAFIAQLGADDLADFFRDCAIALDEDFRKRQSASVVIGAELSEDTCRFLLECVAQSAYRKQK